MIFKRKKHPLPKFPDSIIPTFMKLCEVIADDKFMEFAEEAHQYINSMEDNEDPKEQLNKRLMDDLIDRARLLLDEYSTKTKTEKALIVGAIRYFAMDADPVPDSGFRSGLVDDVKIMNFVLEELGMVDQAIDV